MAWGDNDPTAGQATAKAGWGDNDPDAAGWKPVATSHNGGVTIEVGVGPKPKPKPSAAEGMARQYFGGLSEGISGLADMVVQASPVGTITNALRNGAALAELMDGKGGPNVTAAPMSAQQQAATRATPAPQGTPERVMRTIGQMTPNALAPGSAARRFVNVIVPAVTSEGAGEAADAAGGNALTVDLARAAGAVGGSALASTRLPNALRNAAEQTPDQIAADLLSSRAGADPAALRARARAITDAGVAPTLVDVIGDKGRRVVRAVGVKSEQAGETLADNARSVSSTAKPAIMAATQKIGPNQGTTADELAQRLTELRDKAANTNYAKPYSQMLEVPDTVKDMLRDPAGRSIIGRARADAIENQDWGAQVELDRLLRPTEDGQLPQISGGTLDRLAIAARERGATFAQSGRNYRAKGAFGRQTQINGVLDNAPGLDEARADYRAKSQAIDVLGKGRADLYSTDPADYGRWLNGLSPEARDANKVAIRQEILDTLGGQRSSTFGSVDELATSEYAKDNLRQALGPEADRYIAHLSARLAQVRNAGFVSPNAGSRTGVLENDLTGVKRAAEVGKGALSALRGDVVGAAGKLGMWFLSRGVTEQQAQALASASVDPARLPHVLGLIEQRLGQRGVREFMLLRNAVMVGGASTALSASGAQARQRQTSPQ